MREKHDIRYLVGICFVTSLGGMLFGYDTAVISGAVDPLKHYFDLTPAMTGWAVSNVVIGCVIGSVTAGRISQHLGRKKILMISAVLFAISAIGSAVATSFWFFVVLRIVGGVAVGQASVISPMYMSEVAPKDYRGRFVCMHQQSIVIGQTVVFFVNYLIAKGMGELWLNDLGWRYMFASETIPAVIFWILLFYIPESPRWCAANKQYNKALTILTRISNKAHAQHLLDEIVHSLGQIKANVSIRKSGLMPILIIGIIIASMQQIIGINAVLYYAPQFLKPITGNTESAMLQTTIMGVFFIFSNALGMYLIDSVGRVPLLKVGSVACFVGMLLISYAFYMQITNYLALVGLIVYVVGFAVGWGCCCWTLIAEIFPNSIRSSAMSYAVCSQWIAGFVVTLLFPIINENSYLVEKFHGAFSFWIFSFFCVVAYVFVAAFVVETKGVSLEKMGDLDKDMMEKIHAKKEKNVSSQPEVDPY